MALQTINLGTYANDGTGDDLRTAFNKVNANLIELFNIAYGAHVGSVPPIGTGVEEGELWWSTTEGKLYVYYSGAWVEASTFTPVLFDISASSTTGGASLDLAGTNASLTSVVIEGSTNITVTRTGSGTITLSSDSYTGNVVGDVSGTVTGALIGNVTGNVTGEHFGPVTGDVTGNVSGNAGTVTNGIYTTSSINELADVDTITVAPTTGQALVWDNTNWVPGNVAATAGGNLDFGTFAAPEGFTLDLGTF